MKKRFTEEQIIKALKRQETGESPKDLCRELGIHEQTLYVWKKKYAGMGISEAKRLRELEHENQKLKKMLANAMIDIDDLKAVNAKKLVKPGQKRRAVAFLRDERCRSVSRACRLLRLARSTFDYIPIPRPEDERLRSRLKELAGNHKRWGCPRFHSILRKEGIVKNHKRTERIYVEEKLQIRRRKRKKLTRVPRVARTRPTAPDVAWSMDFVHDWLLTKRKLKCLTIVDDFTKESIGILVGHSISGAQVAMHLASLDRRPKLLRSDNGPEFGSNAFRAWIDSTPIEHDFITPGKPNENAFIESFNSRFRDECLNEHVFRDLDDAKRKIREWESTYNEFHPHSTLGMRSPKEFAENWKAMITT